MGRGDYEVFAGEEAVSILYLLFILGANRKCLDFAAPSS